MRILNICANSATCERLWSVYGITLTKLRNRLGTETLTSLGELKMHIRDEHMRKETKTRMKRLFSIRAQAAGPIPTPTALVEPAENDNDDSDAAAAAATTQTNSGDAHNGFREIADEQARRVAEDETDQAPVTVSTIIGRPIPLEHLFDFTDSHWTTIYEKTARRSFDEELELYELLDMDAAGEEEADIDIDDSTADVMLG